MGANAKSVAPQGNKGQAGSKHMIDCDGLVEYLHRLEVLLIGGQHFSHAQIILTDS